MLLSTKNGFIPPPPASDVALGAVRAGPQSVPSTGWLLVLIPGHTS